MTKQPLQPQYEDDPSQSTTNALLDQFARHLGSDAYPAPDRGIAHELQVSPAYVSKWRTGAVGMGDANVIKICRHMYPDEDGILVRWESYWLARVAAERVKVKTEEDRRVKDIWHWMAENSANLLRAAGQNVLGFGALLLCAGLLAPSPAEALAGYERPNNLYYVKYYRSAG